ncbi:MAG: hypothetical protein FK732_03550 [Asgard group archaeon]|nr:hypothetical protein [Asgard group archaeon]
MALKKLKGMIWGRFITLVLLIAIPLFYVLLIVGSLPSLAWFDPPIITYEFFTRLGPAHWNISFMSDAWAKVFAYGFLPLFFSLPWVVFLLVDINRVAETFQNMGRAMRRVSLGLGIFYSACALIVFIFFILPFGSPIIVVFASFGLIPWVIKKKTGRNLPWWMLMIPSLLLAAIPVVLAVGFCTNYADIWANLWGFWSGIGPSGTTILQQLGFAHYMWGFGYSVAIGAVFAGFANFVYEGASYMDRFTKKPKGFLYIVEFVVAAVVFTLYMIFPVSENVGRIMFYIISGLTIFVGVMEFLMRFFRKRRRSDRDNVPFGAYVMVPLFVAVDLVRLAGVDTADGILIRNSAITAALGLVCVVYMVIFLMAYSFAGETYKSRWSKGYGEDDDDDDEDSSDEE